jgi:hypothetical protein
MVNLRLLTASAADHEAPAADGYASGAIGAGDSLIALLQYLADHGCDRLLISDGQCRHDCRETGTGHIGIERDRVRLEDATLSLQQPFEVHAVLCGELANMPVSETQHRPDFVVRNIARRGNILDAPAHRLFEIAAAFLCFGAHRLCFLRRMSVRRHCFQ